MEKGAFRNVTRASDRSLKIAIAGRAMLGDCDTCRNYIDPKSFKRKRKMPGK
jgi:hypothetical protein